MIKTKANTRLLMVVLLPILLALVLTGMAPYAFSQGASSDLTTLSYDAFSGLTGVYHSGGTAPNLVADLNVALARMHEAKSKRTAGDETNARVLEEQARSTIDQVTRQIPDAQQRTESEHAARTFLVFISIPLTILGLTFVFYAALKTQRWYEKLKLYEMRIIEKENKN